MNSNFPLDAPPVKIHTHQDVVEHGGIRDYFWMAEMTIFAVSCANLFIKRKKIDETYSNTDHSRTFYHHRLREK